MPINPETRKPVLSWMATREADTRRYLLQEAFENVWMPRQAPHGVSGPPPGDGLALYDFVAKTLGDVPITYLEFGVATGMTMRAITERFPHPGARFFGFDSFEGLPEDWIEPPTNVDRIMPRGTFSRHGVPPQITDQRVTLVKGWSQNTLPSFIESDRFTSPTKPILVHFDADLYSSTLFILGMLWPRVDEYYFMFDEFVGEEMVALRDFASAFPIDIEFICQTNANDVPLKVFGRFRRIPLQIDRT